MTFPRLVFVAALLAASGAAPADELTTIAGRSLRGTLVKVDAGAVSFKADGGDTVSQVPVKEVAAVDLGQAPAAEGAKRDEIELTDGSVILCSKFGVKGKGVAPVLLPGPAGAEPPAIDLPLGNLFSVLRGADDPKNREEWRKLLAGRGKRDLFVIRQADGLNPLPGTVLAGTDTGEAVTFEREDGPTVTLKLSRASGGIVFNQPPRDVIPTTVCKVRDVFGNVLYARAVELTGPGLRVETVSGAVFDYPSLKGVAKLDFSEGNVAYLSDLAAKVDAPPAVEGEPHFTVLKDRTPDGAALRLDGASFTKGLWVFPETTLTYKLNGDYREFRAVVGVDDRVPVANSSVRLTITGDGRALYSQAVTRKDKPKPLALDVKNVKDLTIMVDRDALYLGNQVDLAEARVQK